MFFAALGIAVAVLACREITAPLFAPHTSQYQNGTGTVIVSPANMRGWAFYNDQADAPCTDTSVCRLVQGPGSPSAGTGSAELATGSTSDGVALVLQDYKGTRLDSITDLHYSTYRQTADAGNNFAIALQFNVDYDLTDQSAGYQGRLVYEPYQGVGGNVPRNTWQSWDARAGRWWGTRASVPVNGVLTTNPCVQATPCTWTEVLGAFPNIGVHRSYGAVVLKAGSGWAGFRGNVDMLVIGVGGVTTTYDFEPYFPVPAAAPDSIPIAVWDSLTAPENVLSSPPGIAGRVIRNLVYVAFQPSTTLAERRAAIASIAGEVVGGWKSGDPEHVYAVRIPYVLTAGDSASGPLLRAIATLEANPAVEMAIYSSLTLPTAKYRRPMDGAGFTSSDFERSQPVPAQAPASISSVLWDSLLAPTNLMTESPGRHGTWVRNVMYVLFKPTATQADRQAAIDLINGEVVGGVSEVPGAGPRGEREYIVRIPDALPGDSISGPVLRARAKLIGHPAIVWAIPVNMDKNVPYYRKPTDGPG